MSPTQAILLKVTAAVLLAATIDMHFIEAASVLATREDASANANGPLPGWNLVGCFDDTSTFKTPITPKGFDDRTLRAQYLLNATGMTPAMCTEYCSNFTFPYGFAGVELGTQCFCDGVIQLTANQTDISECNTPCAGDSTQICGGTNRISVFTNGTPGPKIPTFANGHDPNHDAAFIPLWEYAGCFSDNPTNHTMTLVPDLAGLDANTCVVACQNLFPFTVKVNPVPQLYAGLENGNQCWCGTSLSRTSKKVPDIACASMGCMQSNDQACGGLSTMLVYQLDPLRLQDCSGPATFDVPFQINIVFYDGGPTVPVTMTSIVTHTNLGFQFDAIERDAAILSHCPTCPNPILFELHDVSQWELLVVNFSNPTINKNFSTVAQAGGANFVDFTDDDGLFLGYCTGLSPIHPTIPALTAFAAHDIQPFTLAPFEFNPQNFISFALCKNMTAGGRLDIVYRPATFVPGITNLIECKDVVLEMDYNVTVPAGVGFL